MKVKITQNKLQVGRSITVELLKPVRVNGKPTHEFVFSKTVKTRLWSFGNLTKKAKEKLFEFWYYLEFFLQDAKPASRDRILKQVEAVIPRLSPADYAEAQAQAERIQKEKAEWMLTPEAARMRLELDVERRRRDWLASRR